MSSSIVISIHALCEEGDAGAAASARMMAISIHALCEEGDRPSCIRRDRSAAFLSTPSARRATAASILRPKRVSYFYPRPLRGGRPAQRSCLKGLLNFYPRPLRGGRLPSRCSLRSGFVFLSTPSARRATSGGVFYWDEKPISIHALCEEGDDRVRRVAAYRQYFYPRPLRGGRPPTRWSPSRRRMYFYPRPLRGGRRSHKVTSPPPNVFLSTPSARRATEDGRVEEAVLTISIHALCEEGDSKNRDKISIFKQIIQHSARI